MPSWRALICCCRSPTTKRPVLCAIQPGVGAGLRGDLDGLEKEVLEKQYLNHDGKGINKMMIIRDGWCKEVPTPIKFGTHVKFVEDAKHREKCILMEEGLRVETAEAAATCKRIKVVKPLQRKGAFKIIWRRTHADTAG